MHVFLSYRRSDSAGHAGRLLDALERQFGDEGVFQDIEAIAPGTDFVVEIERALARSDALVVLIGSDWLEARTPEGERRLERPDDFVRIELATALRRGLRVLPVLVDGATMPADSRLPGDLAPLARIQAIELSETRWDFDVGRLVTALRGGARRVAAPPSSARTRRLFGAAAVVAVAATTAVWYGSGARHADIAGRWNLPSGSHWIVTQQGRAVTIEEVHYDSREVWKRGAGTVTGDRLEYRLDYVFERDVSEAGTLQVSEDARVMRGRATWQPSARQDAVVLTRN